MDLDKSIALEDPHADALRLQAESRANDVLRTDLPESLMPIFGPPERRREGWGGRSEPVYCLIYPCGCSRGNRTYVCTPCYTRDARRHQREATA
jgi:hypothetical protein